MLIPPYILTLTAPRELSATELQILHDVGVEGKRRDDWLAVAKPLRQ